MVAILGETTIYAVVAMSTAFAVGAFFGFVACMKLIDYFDRTRGDIFDWESTNRKDREVFVSGYQRGWADHRNGVSYSPDVAEAGRKFAK